ncbi:MAG: hypothetical protein EXR72_11895 [Myxococcales bacterium]|nr:hypothetical protein [Myxococcales bacterium]
MAAITASTSSAASVVSIPDQDQKTRLGLSATAKRTGTSSAGSIARAARPLASTVSTPKASDASAPSVGSETAVSLCNAARRSTHSRLDPCSTASPL